MDDLLMMEDRPYAGTVLFWETRPPWRCAWATWQVGERRLWPLTTRTAGKLGCLWADWDDSGAIYPYAQSAFSHAYGSLSHCRTPWTGTVCFLPGIAMLGR